MEMSRGRQVLLRSTIRKPGPLAFNWGNVPILQVQGVFEFPPFCLLFFRSVLGESFSDTPMVLPISGHLDSIARMMVGDYYIGRGSRQRALGQSPFCNDFKVSVYGREMATEGSKKLQYDTSTGSHVDALGPTANMPLQIDSIMPWGHHHTVSFERCSRMFLTVMSHQAIPIFQSLELHVQIA